MALTLITGPANAAKAGAILDAYAELAGREPILVVPTFADVDFYQRDLARRGAVFATDVRTFAGLFDEIAKRTGTRARPVGRQARERVAARAVARSELDVLAGAASSAGFPRHLIRFAQELEQARIEPARFTRALRDWGTDNYAAEVARLYSRYRDELDRLGRPDAELARVAALDALRHDPRAWTRTAVLFYGFDELDPLQLDAVETLVRHADAPVWFSLTHEPGRHALAARARTHQELLALGAVETRLPAAGDYYKHEALAGIERGLMEPGARTVAPADAVLLLEGGGERAEVELVAANVRRLLDEGTAPEQIAVVHRALEGIAPLIEAVFAGYGIPAGVPRTFPAGHCALGRGIVAALRCALGGGDAEDLVDYLRTPGVARPERVDALEQAIRVDGVRTYAQAREIFERGGPGVDALDWIARDARRGTEALCEQLERQVAFMLARPHRRQAAVLDEHALRDARAAAAITGALREFRRLPPQLAPDAAQLADVIAELEVFVGGRSGPGLVTVVTPQAVRARQFEALFCMGLAQGVFPRPAAPQPFFDDSQRRAINAATGLGLRVRDDALQTERFFFYMACSRPTRLLGLSWPSADDDGKPHVRSVFVDDVLDLLPTAPELQRRDLGAVGWEAPAPTPREAQRATIAAQRGRPEPGVAPLSGAVLGAVRATESWSATALETWIGCPVRWLAERRLRLKRMEPDGEAIVRGQLTHAVLQDVFERLGGPLTESDLPLARRLLDAALERGKREIALSVSPERLAAEARRVEADLVGYLEHAATEATGWIPTHLELAFGEDAAQLPSMPLGDGRQRLRGRIDRIDVRPGSTQAIVWDYKGRGGGPPHAKWGAPPRGEGKIQLALYMLAAERLLGLDPVAGLYQPMNARRLVPRGAVCEEGDPGIALVGTDRVDREALRELLDRCEADALKAIAELQDGLLEARPRTCGWKGGCDHPSICRSEVAEL